MVTATGATDGSGDGDVVFDVGHPIANFPAYVIANVGTAPPSARPASRPGKSHGSCAFPLSTTTAGRVGGGGDPGRPRLLPRSRPSDLSRPELVEEREAGGVAVIRLRYQFEGNLDPMARAADRLRSSGLDPTGQDRPPGRHRLVEIRGRTRSRAGCTGPPSSSSPPRDRCRPAPRRPAGGGGTGGRSAGRATDGARDPATVGHRGPGHGRPDRRRRVTGPRGSWGPGRHRAPAAPGQSGRPLSRPASGWIGFRQRPARGSGRGERRRTLNGAPTTCGGALCRAVIATTEVTRVGPASAWRWSPPWPWSWPCRHRADRDRPGHRGRLQAVRRSARAHQADQGHGPGCPVRGEGSGGHLDATVTWTVRPAPGEAPSPATSWSRPPGHLAPRRRRDQPGGDRLDQRRHLPVHGGRRQCRRAPVRRPPPPMRSPPSPPPPARRPPPPPTTSSLLVPLYDSRRR